MRITYIKLVGYERMGWGQVELFEMHLREKIQLILGSNGSGKSSLMSELTPLPANPSDYSKEGSKTIRISHRSSDYQLVSSFSPKQHHSFEKDGEELNPGGTVTVQKELVEEHFGITMEIRDLFLGEEKFTQMGPGRRREWFTRLADTNYDYALWVYSQFREKARDISGALKLAKNRLVAETAKIISMEEHNKLKAEVDALHAEMRELLSLSAPIEHNLDDLKSRQEAGLAELNALSLRLLRMRTEAPAALYGEDDLMRNEWGELEAPRFRSVADVESYMNFLKERIAASEAILNNSVKDHKRLKDNLEVLKKTGAEGIQSLSKRMHELQNKRNGLLASRKLKLEGLDAATALQAFDACHETLFSVFSEIPENEDKRFSQATLAEFTERQKVARATQQELTTRAAQISAKQQHLEQHRKTGETECPRCKHRWNPGFSETVARELAEHAEECRTGLQKCEREIAECDKKLAEIAQYGALYRQYSTCVRSWPVLKSFWDYLTETNMVIAAPRQALGLLSMFRRDLEIEQEAWTIDKEVEEVRKLIAQAESVGDASLTEIQQQLDEVTVHVEGITYHLARLRQRYSEHAEYRRNLIEAFQLAERIERMAQDLTNLTATMVETSWRETIAHCIRQVGSQLSKKEDMLNQISLQVNIVKDLEAQIKILTIEEQAAKALVATLSPTDGLIAEGLMGFIRNFVRQMNALIKKIWAYTLRIQECGVSSEKGVELDYKFPIMVRERDNVKSDVAKGSTGMKEVIDLAFVVVGAKHLGLAEAPLYLDEFGHGFDDAHRFAAVNCIKSLMDTSPATQLFMVSHYESSYSAFTNAEICVLDKSNIIVPVEMKYNQHVTID
jgi:hypothetical protein